MASAYDNYDYPSYWTNRAYEHGSEVFAIKKFFNIVGQNERVLEIGAGYGRLAKVYGRYAREATLVDPSGGILKKAKSYLNGELGKVKFVCSTLQDLPKKVKGTKFDVVILVRVMHHIDDPQKAIKVVSTYLSSGGYFILEFANKVHGKAIVSNLLSGNFTFPLDIFPLDRRSRRNIKKNSILFLNHHPDVISEILSANGFRILEKRSVSNIRSRIVKKIIPADLLIGLESMIQKPLAKINFGPSIFILAQKK